MQYKGFFNKFLSEQKTDKDRVYNILYKNIPLFRMYGLDQQNEVVSKIMKAIIDIHTRFSGKPRTLTGEEREIFNKVFSMLQVSTIYGIKRTTPYQFVNLVFIITDILLGEK